MKDEKPESGELIPKRTEIQITQSADSKTSAANDQSIAADKLSSKNQKKSNMNKLQTEIDVTLVDSNLYAQIVNIVKTAEETKKPHIIKLNLISASGEVAIALQITDCIHKSNYVDLHTVSNGKLGTAGTILAAAGEPGYRIAKMSTRFQLIAGKPYPVSKDLVKTLKPDDYGTIKSLIILTGKKKQILAEITRNNFISDNTAKKLGIIDDVDSLQSKYRKKSNRGRKPKNNVQSADNAYSTVS